MESNKKREINIVLEKLKKGTIDKNVYDVICRNEERFQEIGIVPDEIKDLLERKVKLAFYPDPLAYAVENQKRVDYLHENINNPNVQVGNENESRYFGELMRHKVSEEVYNRGVKIIARKADNEIQRHEKAKRALLFGDREVEVLTDILFDRSLTADASNSYSFIKSLLKKYDLQNAYDIDKHGLALKWKTGLALESKGFLSTGATEKLFKDTGISIDEVQSSIQRYNADRLRVSSADIQGAWLNCKVDGLPQEVKIASVSDVDSFTDTTGLAVKYYKDVLDSNREHDLALVDESVLNRLPMKDIERLEKIYRNGMDEQDTALWKLERICKGKDLFWQKNASISPNDPIELQKRNAFECMVEYISDIRPDLLNGDEIIQLTKVKSQDALPGREEEHNLMRLPEPLLPFAEQTGEFNKKMIDYVKVIRGTEYVTPRMAFNSMDYFLSHRLPTEWSLTNTVDKYGRDIERVSYLNREMTNPSEKFIPNLLSELQWEKLQSKYPGATSFIPTGAFRKERISDVEIYSTRPSGMAIRCKVDNIQQNSRTLADIDVENYSTLWDTRELAVGYFKDAFAKEDDMRVALSR